LAVADADLDGRWAADRVNAEPGPPFVLLAGNADTGSLGPVSAEPIIGCLVKPV
jgi:hypothetical protein